ncbi:hypothetical protein LguiA_018464 [Lonicera macranthoides]
MSAISELLSQKFLFYFPNFRNFLFCVSTYISPLLGFISTFLFRLKRNGSDSKENSDSSMIIFEPKSKKDSEFVQPKAEQKESEEFLDFKDWENDGITEKEPEFCFKFKFPTYEELVKSKGEKGDFVSFEDFTPTSSNRYEFNSGKSISYFIKEPEILNCEVKDVNRDSNGGYFGHKSNDLVDGLSSNSDFFKFMIEDVHEEVQENSISNVCEEKEEAEEEEKNLQSKEKISEEPNTLEENLESDSDSSTSNHLYSVMSSFVDAYGDGFLSDGDFGGEFEQENLIDIDGEKIESGGEISDSDESNKEEFDEETSDAIEKNKILEEANSFLSEKDFQEQREKTGEFSGKQNFAEESEKEKSSAEDSEENKMETQWEHQELIEQLKMELKKVRATGLPTILEESESPKVMEDLKPWKIHEKFHHENPMDELQKLYRSYRERMRKLDILNYQKMYAIGFLQLKDPLEPMSTKKSSFQEIATLLSQNLIQRKHKMNQSESTMKFIKELQSDLEVVYVGQMCLSWEILHWQYGKAFDLWDSDPRGIRRFNEVAGEFQQFQVLMQRFIEDERFQGPRMQNYIRNRCILRNLLQVPLIREDNSKDKRKARLREKGEYAITSDVLVEIMEESIRIFWQFVRADKDCTNLTAKGKTGKSRELQDPADSTLFVEVQKNLIKKERKLKDILRSGNCILRKYRKCREDSNADQVLYFFSQVDMKLVSRVLNMSRITTDQLIWCRNKLSKISLVDRKIHIEPSFLLFPC